MSLVVLSRKRLRRFSTTMYLLFLAGSDLTLLWTSLLRRVLKFVARIDILNYSEFHCRTNEWLAMTSGSFSIWLLVLMTIERAVFTKSPVFAKRRMTRKFAFVLCSIVLAAIALINIHYIFGKRISYAMNYTGNGTLNNGQVNNTLFDTTPSFRCTYVSPAYANFAAKLWPALGLGMFNLLPLILIFTGNISIFLKLRQQRRKLQPTSKNPGYLGYDRNTKATKMLFVLCGFFLFTTTPYSIFFTLYFFIQKDLDDHEFAGLKLGYSIIMILLWSNFTFNFFLYFVSGSLFKKEWGILVTELQTKVYRICGRSTTVRIDTGLVVQTGDTGVAMQSGDTGVVLDSRHTGLFVPSGDTGVAVQAGNTGVDVQSGDTAVAVQSSDTGVVVHSGDTGVAVQSGDTGVVVQSGDMRVVVQSGDT